jgi:murein tripeptide amidase MpaA
MRFSPAFLALCLAAASEGSEARPASDEAILPPVSIWDGKSRELVVPASDPWVTPAEATGLKSTPRYDETIRYLRRLEAASPNLKLLSLGKSPEGRDIWMVVASKERAFTPESLKATGKPTLFAQAGIHSGEIDGKDAGLMLLRDMTVRGNKRGLLDRANLLFVPIFSVDGHERFSAYGRINQRGPVETGWRTTSQNLNLNRDYAKLDAPEMRALVRALDAWGPDLYLDLHVTDGMDHQYDVTYSFNGPNGWSPSIARWLEQTLVPAWTADLTKMGHTPGAYPQLLDERDPEKGSRPSTPKTT